MNQNSEAAAAVAEAAARAAAASPALAAATQEQIDGAILAMVDLLEANADAVIAANEADVRAAKAAGATVIQEPYHPDEDPEGWIATFADPDDNYFQLVSPFPG